MKKRLLKCIYILSYYIGLIHLFYFFNRKKQIVLVYHHVINDSYWDDKYHLQVAIKKSVFDLQLDIINKRKGFSSDFGDKGCLITFDDGYSCALQAAECLNRYNAKGIFFCPINNIRSREPLWIDKILLWMSYVPEGEYLILGELLIIDSVEKREEYCNYLIDKLYTNYQIDRLLEDLNHSFSFEEIKLFIDPDYYKSRFIGLSFEEINLLKKNGHIIAAHSVNHDIMRLLTREQLEDDFKACQEELGHYYNSTYYAYPFGHSRQVDDEVFNVMKTSKFKLGFMNEKINNPHSYNLSRISIAYYSNRYEIEANLSGYADWLRKIICV